MNYAERRSRKALQVSEGAGAAEQVQEQQSEEAEEQGAGNSSEEGQGIDGIQESGPTEVLCSCIAAQLSITLSNT